MTVAMADGDEPFDPNDELARRREALLARRTKVMYLRNAGATWAVIAQECGVSEGTVRADYRVVCRDINGEQPADVVARHRAVIFDIQRANYPAMMRGDKDAANSILKALDREAKLLGLDAPTRILAATSAEDFAVESARLIDRILALDPNTLKEITRVRRPEVIDAEPEAGADAPTADPGPAAEEGHAPVDGQPGREHPAGDADPGAVDASAPARAPGADDGGAGTEPDPARDAGGDQGRPRGPVHPSQWSNLDDDE